MCVCTTHTYTKSAGELVASYVVVVLSSELLRFCVGTMNGDAACPCNAAPIWYAMLFCRKVLKRLLKKQSIYLLRT